MSKEIYIVYAKRTPIGKYRGSLKDFSAADLQSFLIKDAKETLKIDTDQVDEVIVGHVLSAGQGQGVARQAALQAGLSHKVVAYSVNMVCGSGMKSILLACSQIASDSGHLIFAGGTESMSQAPYLLSGESRDGLRLGHQNLTDSLVLDGLTDAFDHQHMGITAERVSEQCGVSRADQDAFAFASQVKARAAQTAGHFKEEIIGVEIKGRHETVFFDTDEYINWTSTIEKLEKLRPAFQKDGTVTAGNASGINDGASLVVLADQAAVDQYHLTPLVRIVGSAQVGIDPAVMGLGPIDAVTKVLEKTGLSLLDIDLYEMNEAFAAQSVAVMNALAPDEATARLLEERVNVCGGAIALGHPIGASGNRICVTLIHQMLRTQARYGCATLCIGGGMGTAIIFERV